MTRVWTDGSYYNGNGMRCGGWAALIERDGTPQVRIVGAERDTNQHRMELTAVIKALERLSGPIEVRTDSPYVHRCFSEEWHVRWRRDGRWRGSNGAVANRDLWERLLALVEDGTRSVRFEPVKGHSTDENNNLVHRLSGEARERLAASDLGA